MSVTEKEKISYLANLIAVSRADGIISPSETLVIEGVQKRIRARKTELNKADLTAQDKNFTPIPVGCFSSRIANLEDMIKVSLADGVLDNAEKPLILNFAKQAGINNEQFQLILSEVKSSLIQPETIRTCTICSAKTPLLAKFCPDCGAYLTNTDKSAGVAVEYTIPSSGITIEFAESTATGFVDATREAKSAPQNGECKRGKKNWYMAAWPKSSIAETSKLVECLKGMRNRKVWVDGEESSWDEVFGFTWCCSQRNTAYRPVEYCFGVDEKRLNLWGCKNARLDWTKWSDWFTYGSFKKVGLLKGRHVFTFDKKRIRHELEANLFRFRFCPHISYKLIEAVITQLPDEVEVKPNGSWMYKHDYEESPGAIKIVEKEVVDGYTYTKEYHSSGVVPRTPAIGLEILKKAFNISNVDASGLESVLSYRDE